MTKLKQITIELPENWVEQLEKLEKLSNKKKDYFIQESLYRQLEDLNDYEIGVKALEKRSGITYNSEQATQILKEWRAAKKAQQNL